MIEFGLWNQMVVNNILDIRVFLSKYMALTKSQIEKMAIAIVNAIIQELQKCNKNKVGGFLPLALIPIIASILGGVGTVAGTVASRVQQSQADKETARHNRVLEEQSKKTGTGRTKGKGLRFLPLNG